MERLSCGLELKFAGDAAAEGSFEGYASVFGVRDSYGDVIVPGAFAATLASMRGRGFNIPMYLNHGAALGGDNLPAGVWDSISEDETGLAVKGRLLGLNTETGRYRYELAKGGALRGMSIGYKARQAVYGKTADQPRRTLKAVDLFEISLVDDPANPAARVMSLKSAAGEEVPPERLIEDALRDAGYSRRDSETLISQLKANRGRGDPGTDQADAAALQRLLQSIQTK